MKRFVHSICLLSVVSVLILGVSGLSPGRASAEAVQVGKGNDHGHNTTSLSASLDSGAATAGNLLIVICAARSASGISVPSGYTTAVSQTGAPSQAIFYKVAEGGESSATCSISGGNTFMGAQIYEYSGLVTDDVLDGVASASGTGSSVSSGSVSTAASQTLLIAGTVIDDETSYSGWSNSFTEEYDFANDGGRAHDRQTYGGASRVATSADSYSTTASTGGSGAWRGQIAAFKVFVPVLAVDIVDGAGDPVANPSAGFAPVNTSFACQTAAATLGTASQRVRVTNTTGSGDWTLTLEPTDGTSAEWSNGTDSYAFNDPAGAPPGCESGQLAVDPSGGSVTPQGSCGTAGLSLGSGSAFSSTEQVMALLTASGSQTGCEFDITGIELTQQIPAEVPASQSPYSIDMTLTITAN